MTDLIPRDVLFGNPERAAPFLSPDGTQFVFLAPHDGVLSVWVRSVDRDDTRMVASDARRPIRNAFWSPDGARVLYLQDLGGNEDFHLFAADPRGGEAPVDLTPYDGVRVDVQTIDPHRPDRILVVMNRRNPQLFDVYRLDPHSGKATLDTENPGTIAAFADDMTMTVRAGVIMHADASNEIVVRDDANAPWRTLAHFDPDDGTPSLVGFTVDGGGLLVVSSAGGNAARLMRYDLAAGTAVEIAGDAAYDVHDVQFSPKTKTPIAASIVRERRDWIVLDPAYADDFAALAAQVPGDASLTSIDRDDRTWLVASNVDAGSVTYWSYDRTARRATKLFAARPSLEGYALSPMTPISFQARDGLTIHGYLTTPAGVEAKRLPAIVLVHGGPWVRDEWGYNSTVQWLANRGYAVLQPNYRGSTGYGKAFLNAGDREWAGSMRTDLLDAKAWLVHQGIADPLRVGIMGGSYGGYAVLTALTFEPLAFACGVDIVGPSNLNTLLASIPPYWETLRATFTRRMGETEAFLREQSPLFRAGEIRAPLLIGQGANDPRVKIAESDQIVAAMRERKLDVTYIVFDDEGHGFARPENAKRFNAAVEAFLARHLGGRTEPPAPHEAIDAFVR
ncbi:peptidase S9 [Vulcanimicrobium alpinum]|uniref:Peptidase S9 n=1 Tax=Vulcanimicrobium alpinum TaxID=3016050 RepID=A0AAN1XX02_UNVUL|nr:S9 family peptidase [Vulcanimicrobium alpinum]BDE06126.1 peptidase S9 [Vulcanimicrobium alpinum]